MRREEDVPKAWHCGGGAGRVGMGVAGSRVGIVGGSVAGCAMAVAAGRLGCEVTVFEASAGGLEDRGAGIAIPLPLRSQLAACGYLPQDAPYCHPAERLWITADPAEPAGRILWRHTFPGAAHNWGVLWRNLRSLVPDVSYRKGQTVRALHPEADEVRVVLDDGSVEWFDALIGADGYRSAVRGIARPDVEPVYVGYVLWRGNFAERLMPDRAAAAVLDDAVATICFRGGHAMIYLIPGHEGTTSRGARRVNWAVYGSPPSTIDLRHPVSFPPGQIPAALVDRLAEIVAGLPPVWADVVRAGGPEVMSVQPIYDHECSSFVSGRVLLVGDAATLARPHSASGAVKAIGEALALERLEAVHDSWPELLAALDSDRCLVARELVETSRLLGRGLVEHTPDWAAMSTQQAEQFITGLIAGRSLYLQPSAPDQSR